MAGESRAYGVGATVFFDGRTCTVKPRDNAFDGFLEAEAIKARQNPLESLVAASQSMKAADGKPDIESLHALSQVVMQEAKTWRYCTGMEKDAFEKTPYGQAITLWYCLRHNFDKDWTVDRVRYVLGESMRQALRAGGETVMQWVKWKEELFDTIDRAGGEDLLGNLTGLRPQVRTEVQAPENSSGDSPKSTDTPPNSVGP